MLYTTGKLVQPLWYRLTHINSTSRIADGCLLRQCPNLVFGNFMVTSSHWPGEPIMGREDIRVFLPCLESLALRDGAHDPMTIMFIA